MKEDVRVYNVDCKIFITTSRSEMWDVVCLSNSSQFSYFTFEMTLLESCGWETIKPHNSLTSWCQTSLRDRIENTLLSLGRRAGPASNFYKDKNFSTFYKQVMFAVNAIFPVYKDVLCLLVPLLSLLSTFDKVIATC